MWLARYWLGFSILLVIAGIISQSGAMIGLGVFVGAAGGLAQLWGKHVFDDVVYERRMPENRTFPGERISLTLRLTNDKLLPVPWIEVRDSFPENTLVGEHHTTTGPSPNYIYLIRSTHLTWYQRTNWPIELVMPNRGYYRLGPARMYSGDIFGFFPAFREDENSDALIVYPKLYTLPELGLPPERPFGEKKGSQPIFEDPGRVAGLRDYRPGDQLRRIDWKASARHQELQSRVYEPSSTMQLLIALNVHTLQHSWEGYVPETLERLLSVAGSVARHSFDLGYAVGLIANGTYPTSDRPMRIAAGRNPAQLSEILEALAMIGPLTLTPLDAVITREARSFPFGASLVCITSRMDEALASALIRVRSAGHGVTVISLSEDDFEEDLGKIKVYNVRDAIIALEQAATMGAPEAAG